MPTTQLVRAVTDTAFQWTALRFTAMSTCDREFDSKVTTQVQIQFSSPCDPIHTVVDFCPLLRHTHTQNSQRWGRLRLTGALFVRRKQKEKQDNFAALVFGH